MSRYIIHNGDIWVKTYISSSSPLANSKVISDMLLAGWTLACRVTTGELKMIREEPVKPTYAFRLVFPNSNAMNLSGNYQKDQSILYKHRNDGCSLFILAGAELKINYKIPRGKLWVQDLKPALLIFYTQYGEAPL